MTTTSRAKAGARQQDLARMLAVVLAHPLRRELLLLLAEGGEASPSGLTERIAGRRSVAVVSYHVRQLRDAGLLREARQRPARGAIEHFYVLTAAGAKVVAALGALEELLR